MGGKRVILHNREIDYIVLQELEQAKKKWKHSEKCLIPLCIVVRDDFLSKEGWIFIDSS